MASISALPFPLSSRARRRGVSASLRPPPSSSLSPPLPSRHSSLPPLRRSTPLPRFLRRTARAVAEEEAQVSGGAAEAEEEDGGSPDEQPVSVPVSPSDVLTMFFKAEGMMDESGVSTMSKALEGTEGISDFRVQILEGVASVELTKQTTVQATGVASNLVEIIQGSGFRLQSLNLSFEDEEDAIN